MKVKDAMHKGVDWVSPDTPVTELAKLMRDHDVGSIPIGENDRLVGMGSCAIPLSCLFGDDEVAEIGSLFRAFFSPQDE